MTTVHVISSVSCGTYPSGLEKKSLWEGVIASLSKDFLVDVVRSPEVHVELGATPTLENPVVSVRFSVSPKVVRTNE